MRSYFVLTLGLGSLPGAPPDGHLAPSAVIDRMEDAGRRQRDTLNTWTSIRTYTATNTRLKRSATAKVQFDFTAPGRKTWRILERSGSSLIIDRVIKPILEAETESSSARKHSDIDRTNYRFEFVKFDPAENSYIFEATPNASSKYLFKGRIWVDSATFGVRRVHGSPAHAPSFWVKNTIFTHEYRQFGAFWLPVHHQSQAELRIFGVSTLEIDYAGYTWEAKGAAKTALAYP